jgi:LysR family nitrogen assimilation transcriptional regulator
LHVLEGLSTSLQEWLLDGRIVAAQSGFHLNVIFDVDRVSLTKQMVAEGMGYSILAHAAVQEDIARGLLVGHTIESPGIRSTVSLTTLKDRRSSRLALSWEKILLETLEELVTVGAWKEATLWLGMERTKASFFD